MTDQTLDPTERAALVERYRGGADHFIAAVDGLADAELDARPFEGEWTVREIAHHLADGELNSAVRLRRLIAEDEPLLPGYDEMEFSRRLHYGEREIGPSLAAMAAARAATVQILDRLSDAEWARAGRTASRGPTASTRGSATTPTTRGTTRTRRAACSRPPGAGRLTPPLTHPRIGAPLMTNTHDLQGDGAARPTAARPRTPRRPRL